MYHQWPKSKPLMISILAGIITFYVVFINAAGNGFVVFYTIHQLCNFNLNYVIIFIAGS